MERFEEPVAPSIDDSARKGRWLRAELKRTRLAAGKSQADVADGLGWPVVEVIHIENGNADVSRDSLLTLLDHYEVRDPQLVVALLDAADAAGRESWTKFRDVHSPALLSYLDFEFLARQIRSYQPVYVPGHLQTEEYAFVIQTDVHGKPPEAAERRWEARLRRQKLHEQDTPPRMSFIIDEAALWRQMGGPGVMRKQLERLREWTDESHISLQIIPFGTGGYPGIGFPFVLLELQGPDEADILHLEHATERTTRDSEETGTYLVGFFELERIALSPEDSQTLIDQAIRDLSRTATSSGSPCGHCGPRGSPR